MDTPIDLLQQHVLQLDEWSNSYHGVLPVDATESLKSIVASVKTSTHDAVAYMQHLLTENQALRTELSMKKIAQDL